MTTKADFADCAADLVERGWCQHEMARRVDGEACQPWALVAAAWCLTGAVQAVTVWEYGSVVEGWTMRSCILSAICDIIGLSPTHWNDSPERRQAEVVDVLRLVAERLRTEEGI